MTVVPADSFRKKAIILLLDQRVAFSTTALGRSVHKMNCSLILQRASLAFWVLCALAVVLVCIGGLQSGAEAGILLMVALPCLLVCFGGYKLTGLVIRGVFGAEGPRE